jgi:hypothetical protein
MLRKAREVSSSVSAVACQPVHAPQAPRTRQGSRPRDRPEARQAQRRSNNPDRFPHHWVPIDNGSEPRRGRGDAARRNSWLLRGLRGRRGPAGQRTPQLKAPRPSSNAPTSLLCHAVVPSRRGQCRVLRKYDATYVGVLHFLSNLMLRVRNMTFPSPVLNVRV